MTSDDQPRVNVPVGRLIEAISFIDAFIQLFWCDTPVDGDIYHAALQQLSPSALDGVNERCAARGMHNASQDHPGEFCAEARQWSIELSAEFRGYLDEIGVMVPIRRVGSTLPFS